MTHLLTFDTIHAEAQHEAFTQLTDAGWRAPVVFSHVLFTYTNKNNIRKGAITQLSHSASDAARRLSHNSTKEVTNSLPVSGTCSHSLFTRQLAISFS